MIFLLRMGLMGLLYLFLLLVAVVAWRELRAVPAGPVVAKAAPAGYGYLTIVEAAASGRTTGEVLPLPPITLIGRGAGNTIVLNDPSVSAVHALLTYRQGRWWLEDRGSTNGTVLNGVLVEQPTVASLGDLIELGQVRLRLEAQ
jgi:pSer/pThr/pTyr-binding forkhead associated (FHA) protein